MPSNHGSLRFELDKSTRVIGVAVPEGPRAIDQARVMPANEETGPK